MRYHRVRHRVGANRLVDGVETTCRPGCSACAYDLLSLVTTRQIPQRVVVSWSDDEREAAIRWAAKEHLRASDNLVRRLPMPACVETALKSPTLSRLRPL